MSVDKPLQQPRQLWKPTVLSFGSKLVQVELTLLSEYVKLYRHSHSLIQENKQSGIGVYVRIDRFSSSFRFRLSLFKFRFHFS